MCILYADDVSRLKPIAQTQLHRKSRKSHWRDLESKVTKLTKCPNLEHIQYILEKKRKSTIDEFKKQTPAIEHPKGLACWIEWLQKKNCSIHKKQRTANKNT